MVSTSGKLEEDIVEEFSESFVFLCSNIAHTLVNGTEALKTEK